jgi:ubiquitin carboxyl-terminal hydrolase 10
VNGTSTPKAKSEKSSVKDNKVAYLLFYQKI